MWGGGCGDVRVGVGVGVGGVYVVGVFMVLCL